MRLTQAEEQRHAEEAPGVFGESRNPVWWRSEGGIGAWWEIRLER